MTIDPVIHLHNLKNCCFKKNSTYEIFIWTWQFNDQDIHYMLLHSYKFNLFDYFIEVIYKRNAWLLPGSKNSEKNLVNLSELQFTLLAVLYSEDWPIYQ